MQANWFVILKWLVLYFVFFLFKCSVSLSAFGVASVQGLLHQQDPGHFTRATKRGARLRFFFWKHNQWRKSSIFRVIQLRYYLTCPDSSSFIKTGAFASYIPMRLLGMYLRWVKDVAVLEEKRRGWGCFCNNVHLTSFSFTFQYHFGMV